ncbi:MAG: M13 family metallopeptidase [Chitinophagaceae bacterium]|nr:M13 family metallopeptidase [Chitinophagaceae bacterium]
MSRNSWLALIAIAALAACSPNKEKNTEDFLARNLDTTVDPATDFFQYANGGWIRNNAIPASESSWGVGQLVQQDIYQRLRSINEKAAAANTKKGSIDQKVGDFWASGMDSAGADKQGLAPLQPYLRSIQDIQNMSQLVDAVAGIHRAEGSVLFSDHVGQDDKNSAANAYFINQGGLGMPNRDYYFNTDEKSVNVRNAYQHYMETSFIQLGDDAAAAKQNTAKVMQLETRLAKASRKLADLRDPYKNYNKMSVAALAQSGPSFPWSDYFGKVGITKLDSVIVGQPEFIAALSTELKSTPLADWKNYLRFHLLLRNAAYLDSTSFMNSFRYAQTIRGSKEPKPRWKRVLDAQESVMGEALGQLFVQEYFDAKAKKRYSDLVENIRAAYKERIARLGWMSDSTKQRAFDKLSKITKKVGYPDKWRDFSSLNIDRGPFVLNMMRAREWWFKVNVDKLHKPVDRTEWEMSPQTYNAYYNPSNNEIVLPAGIFAVPGMKDEDLDDAFVYGYAGASTIGHEITHGFDDQGRQYDDAGNLKNWWTDADAKQFSKRAANIIREFNEFMPVDTLHVNGDATQGENIADLGGLLLGLDAFKKTEAYKKNEKIGGLMPLQRFFIGYAYGWMYQTRKESLASQLKTDVHAPERERVNGPMVNIPEFYEAFGVKPGSKMYRADSLRVNIW